MPKRVPDEQPGKSVSELIEQAQEHLLEDIRKAEELIEANRAQFKRLEEIRTASGGKRPSIGPYRYVGMKTIEAICVFLNRVGRAQPRAEIIREVLDGGVYTGKGEGAKGSPEVQVGKSIDLWMLNPLQKKDVEERAGIPAVRRKSHKKPARLRAMMVGEVEMIGLAEWEDEKFKADT